MNVILVRYAYLDSCTLGRLSVPGISEPLATIERPWIPDLAGPGGVRARSCVPDGEYRLTPHDSAKFPGTYILENAALGVYRYERPSGQGWGRTAILIHAGNRVVDVIGCIAVGMRAGVDEAAHVVYQSRGALDLLRDVLGRRGWHSLLIRPTAGTEE